MFRTRSRTVAVLATGAIALIGSASALAAHPKANKKYSGTTSAREVNGFKAAVMFKTSSSGARILNFAYQSFGCFGFGGALQPGVDYYAKPWNVYKVGTIAVNSAGKFSVKNVKSTYKIQNQTTVTTTSVSGKFKSAKTATGTITFSQRFSAPGMTGQSCGPATVTFTAKSK